MTNTSEHDWLLQSVPGAQALYDWFGYWPSFHDAEILDLHLIRGGTSTLKIETWRMTRKVRKGHFVNDKHVLVTFHLDDLCNVELEGFSVQNVIEQLVMTRVDDGIEIDLCPCYGLFGTLTAQRISITIEPLSELNEALEQDASDIPAKDYPVWHQIADVAADLIANKLSFPDGARAIIKLRSGLDNPENDLLDTIVQLNSEMLRFPLGELRDKCAPELIARKDAELEELIRNLAPDILDDCKKIVERYGAPSSD